MTLEEKVRLIKNSLEQMDKEQFKQMLERNGYSRIKEKTETMFYMATSPIETEEYHVNSVENTVIFDINNGLLAEVA